MHRHHTRVSWNIDKCQYNAIDTFWSRAYQRFFTSIVALKLETAKSFWTRFRHSRHIPCQFVCYIWYIICAAYIDLAETFVLDPNIDMNHFNNIVGEKYIHRPPSIFCFQGVKNFSIDDICQLLVWCRCNGALSWFSFTNSYCLKLEHLGSN